MRAGHKFGHRRSIAAVAARSICEIMLFPSARNHFCSVLFLFCSFFFVNIYICYICCIACSAWCPFPLVLLLRLWPLYTFAIFIMLVGIQWAMKYEWFFDTRTSYELNNDQVVDGRMGGCGWLWWWMVVVRVFVSRCFYIEALDYRAQINEYIETWSMKINNIQLPGNQAVAEIGINCYPW